MSAVDSDDGIYFANNASGAKIKALLQAREAGFNINFSDLRVRRAPEFDGATCHGTTPTCGVLPEYLDVPSEKPGGGQ